MGFLSANEVAVIIVVWILISFGPAAASIIVAFYRRWFGRKKELSKGSRADKTKSTQDTSKKG